MLLITLFACTAVEDKIEYPTTVLSENERYEVSYDTTPSPIPLNEEFSIWLTIVEKETNTEVIAGINVDINAEMPNHDHGMSQTPVTSQMDDGRFMSEGMFFQMPGYWHILTWITDETGAIEKTIFEVDCCL